MGDAGNAATAPPRMGSARKAAAVAAAEATASAAASADPAMALPLITAMLAKDGATAKSSDASVATARPRGPTRNMAATSAATATASRQELPSAQPSPQVASAAATVAGATETVPAKSANDTPKHSAIDAMDAASTRTFSQFESLPRASEARVQVAVEAPLRSQAFPAELSEKIVWLAGNGTHTADLSLNPPQLGPLEVRLTVSGSDAGAQFFSPHPVVRDAIEAALPRLRELLAQSGIALGNAQVQQEAFSRGDPGGRSGRSSDEYASGAARVTQMAATSQALRAGVGLVDLYV